MKLAGQSELEKEARYLHSRFFHQSPPEAVVSRYVAANRLCFPALSDSHQAMMRKIVASSLDAEAVELVLRWRKGSPVLTHKIQILFYLVEVRSEYYCYFVNQKPGWLRAVGKLTLAAARTVWKGAKGTLLAWRHGFV